MTGGGPFGLGPSQWADDTSITLCLAENMIERGGFDAAASAARRRGDQQKLRQLPDNARGERSG
ncbi:MAG: ADP-ribosylglycohydrolase family protein [Actinomycetia bacterium]|nr:ADP-ribosylglycohydrolase family protein [Actinomycetes bacterium]